MKSEVHTRPRRGHATLICACLAVGCGSEGAGPYGPLETVLTDEWQLVDRTYPYENQDGETVCAEWRRFEPTTGREVSDREWYDLGKINDLLSGRTADVHVGRIDAIKAAGLSQVVTCDDARKFMRLRREFIEGQGASAADDSTAAPSAASPSGEEPSGEDEFADKIAQGVAADIWTVRVIPPGGGTCSGFLIGPFALITAAHCVSGQSGFAHFEVDFGTGLWWNNGGVMMAYPCISTTPCYVGGATPNATWQRHPAYIGTGDTEHDMAIVFSNGNWLWPGNDPAGWFRINNDGFSVGLQFWMQGYGANQNVVGSGVGVGRTGTHWETVGYIDNPDPEYWHANVTDGWGRICNGDSGSPAINLGLIGKAPSFTPVVVGSLSNHEPPGTVCPEIGNKERYTNLADKTWWIEGHFNNGCFHGASNGNAYIRCW